MFCLLGGWSWRLHSRLDSPLPSAAVHGVIHCDPSVLHVTVVAADSWESCDWGDSSLLM